MIPPFKKYFYPFLLCLNDGSEKKLATIAAFVANYFNLDIWDLQELTKKGSNTKHMSRINYCATYLKRLDLVTSRPKGIYKITQKGKEIIEQKGDALSRDHLKTLPEYIEMQRNATNSEIVYIKEHYNKYGKLVPAYWCNIKNVSPCMREKVIRDTKEEHRKHNNQHHSKN